MGKIKGVDNMGTWRYMICFFMLWFMNLLYLFIQLCERKKSFIAFPTLTIVFEVMNIDGRFGILTF